jgi:ABC-type bacteriocin/lantibiotic exporter with double-glycine peptidase domain
MKRWRTGPPRALLVPEVVQTSLVDCGPAALKAVLEGFGLSVDYEALRERCHTDVDGTSIDALAKLAGELGLDSHEMLVPRDNFLLPAADCLPAIVVTEAGGGQLHFLVVWSTVGPYVQIMDPAGGREWVHKEAFLRRMPDVAIGVTATEWRRWAGSESALAPLRARMRSVGIRGEAARARIAWADADGSFRAFSALDAGVRMIAALVEADAIAAGAQAHRLLQSLLERTIGPDADPEDGIPRRFWWARQGTAPGKLTLQGAVIVHFSARTKVAGGSTETLGRALARPNLSPLRLMAHVVRLDCPRALALVMTALLATAAVTMTDALLFRGALDISRHLSLDYQRVTGLLALVVFSLAGLTLEMFLSATVHRIGLGLETRLRAGLLEKLPRLEDRYLRTRPTSDTASRAHSMQMLREAPALGARIARAVLSLAATTAGIVWLYPEGVGLAVTAALVAVVLSYFLRRPLAEASLRLRTHGGALERFYLDALLGVTPIRVHGAERSVRREHESLLVEWARTARAMHDQTSRIQALQLLLGTSIAVVIVSSYVAGHGPVAALLLLAFWALRIPAAGQELVLSLVAYRDLRTVALRLFASLGATEGVPSGASVPTRPALDERPRGFDLAFHDVSVCPAGTTILRDLTAEIPGGSHVGIVGASGAGKSSLVGLLLGWLVPSKGAVFVDGTALDGARIVELRREIAWVDPAVHLWNRSLLENVSFGGDDDDETLERLPDAMLGADLTEVLSSLPDGMQTGLGEGGASVSGGQGQRVRLARALLRACPRLVILDEPFRGLERERRRELLRRSRARWRGATVLLVSHDVSDTLDLDRVLVMDGGRIVEDGAPRALMANPASRYLALVNADAALRTEVWSAAQWRRFSIERGHIEEAPLEATGT